MCKDHLCCPYSMRRGCTQYLAAYLSCRGPPLRLADPMDRVSPLGLVEYFEGSDGHKCPICHVSSFGFLPDEAARAIMTVRPLVSSQVSTILLGL